MTAQEAVNKIAEHLLGKNWYSYYYNIEDINSEINSEIIGENFSGNTPAATPHTREEAERALIEQALRRNRNNRRKTAEELAISERTLYRKIQKYGLDEEI